MRVQVVFAVALLLAVAQAIVVDDATFSFTEDSVAVHSSPWVERSQGGPLAAISANLHDQVFGLNAAGQIMRFDNKAYKWTRFESTVTTRRTSVKVGCDGTLWMLDDKKQLFKKKRGRQDGEWILETTVAVETFSPGSGYEVWGTDKDGYAVQYQPGDKTWRRAEAKLAQVSVGCRSGSDVWGVSTDGKLWQLLRSNNMWRERATGVKSVSAGSQVYVTDTKGALYRYNPPSLTSSSTPSQWVNLGFAAKTFSTGYDGCLWAINTAGKAFWHKGDNLDALLSPAAKAARDLEAGGSWDVVPGADGIEQIALGQRGELYGVTTSGALKRFNQDTPTKWEDIPASGLSEVTCGCDGESVWGLTRGQGNKAARYRGLGKWEVYGEELKAITLGRNEETVYGVRHGSDGLLASWVKDTKKWSAVKAQTKREDADSLTDLVLGGVDFSCDGSLWTVDVGGALYSKDASDGTALFAYRGDDVKSVSAGKHTYVIDRRNFLFRYQKAPEGEVESKVHWKMMSKQLKQVVAGINGELYGIDLFGKVVQFKPLPDALKNKYQWEEVKSAEPLSHIAVGSIRHIYALDKYGTVLKRTDANTWAVVPGQYLEDISVGCDGAIWGIDSKQNVIKQESLELGWSQVATPSGGPNIVKVTVGRRGIVYGLDTSGTPFRFDYSKVEWTSLKEEPKTHKFKSLAVGCRGELWGVTEAGVVYMSRARAEGAKWILMGYGAKEIAIGDHTYMIDKRHRLARWEPEKRRRFNKWVYLGTMAHVSASIDGAVWGLDDEGDAWVVQKGKPLTMEPPKVEPTTAPIATPEMEAEPDSWALSPYKAGTTDRHSNALEELKGMDDDDDVATMIHHWETHLSNKEADAQYSKKVNNPHVFEEDTVGNSVFKPVSKKIIRERRETFADTGMNIRDPPF